MSGKIQIRMYNVGFGDCFLLILPTKHTILVDAGFHSNGPGPFSGDALVTQIIADVTAATGHARIDVVIATHRHQDHVFAFNSTKWNGASVGEVWLPWVENRKSAEAKSLWKKKDGFALRLTQALSTFNLTKEERDDIDFMLWNAGVDIPGMGFAAWSNLGALNTLHGGFASRDRELPRYLPRTKTFPESFKPAVLPGVRVHVLGPSRDPEFIEELDPKDDDETYRTLALRAAQVAAAGAQLPAPFGEVWEVPNRERGFKLSSSEVERMIELAQNADALAAAEQLDNMINSTSLVLVLQIGTARLLLPGDAEWGTWKRILKDDDACALLKGSTFFKVGHHGSHNATSKTLVEKILPQNIPAMISTQQGTGTWRKDIPLRELLDALALRGIQHVRSDSTGAVPAGFTRGAQWIDLELAS